MLWDCWAIPRVVTPLEEAAHGKELPEKAFCLCILLGAQSFLYTTVCSLRRDAGSALSETLQRGWGSFITAQMIFYYCKTESNGLPSQLAVAVP